MGPPRQNTGNYADNVTAAAEVFAEYGNFIRAVIHYKVQNESLADDLFQDFFLSLVCRPLPKNVKNVKGFLYRAVINDIANAMDRIKRYQARIHRYATRCRYLANAYDPQGALTEAEEMNKMFELIERRLPSCEAQAITLMYRNGHSAKDAAERMNVCCGAVRGYLSLGLRKIRQHLTSSRARLL